VQIGRRLGMSPHQLKEILDGPGHRWRALVEEQIATLDEQVERIARARAVPAHSLDCPTANPVRQCPHFIAELDRLVAAGSGAISAVTEPRA